MGMTFDNRDFHLLIFLNPSEVCDVIFAQVVAPSLVPLEVRCCLI